MITLTNVEGKQSGFEGVTLKRFMWFFINSETSFRRKTVSFRQKPVAYTQTPLKRIPCHKVLHEPA